MVLGVGEEKHKHVSKLWRFKEKLLPGLCGPDKCDVQVDV